MSKSIIMYRANALETNSSSAHAWVWSFMDKQHSHSPDIVVKKGVIELLQQTSEVSDRFQMALKAMNDSVRTQTFKELMFKGFLSNLAKALNQSTLAIRNNNQTLCLLDKKGKVQYVAKELRDLKFGNDSKDYSPSHMLSGFLGEDQWKEMINEPLKIGIMLSDLVLSANVSVTKYSRNAFDNISVSESLEKRWWETLCRHIKAHLSSIGYDVDEINPQTVKAAFDDWEEEGWKGWVESSALIYQGLADFATNEEAVESMYFPISHDLMAKHGNLLAMFTEEILKDILLDAYADSENPLRFGLGAIWELELE